jgi:NAD(P)-dependent dehydrogenase (short-subunit alcohol dehydrogenase family)
MAQAALPHLEKGDAIINTGSIVGKTGIALLIDYSSSKGAIHSFTKSLALNLGEKGIRVNCVVPVRCGRRTFPARCRLKKSKISVTKSP